MCDINKKTFSTFSELIRELTREANVILDEMGGLGHSSSFTDKYISFVATLNSVLSLLQEEKEEDDLIIISSMIIEHKNITVLVRRFPRLLNIYNRLLKLINHISRTVSKSGKPRVFVEMCKTITLSTTRELVCKGYKQKLEKKKKNMNK